MELLILISIPLICLIGFVFVWHIESRNALIFTPFMVLMINELIRVMPGFVYSSFLNITDLYPLIVFFVAYVMLIAGFLFSIGYLKYRSFSLRRFVAESFRKIDNKKLFFPIFSLTILLIVAGLFLYQGLPSLVDAFAGLFKGDNIREIASYVGASRKYITKAHIFGGEYRGQGIIRSLNSHWWPFITSLALIIYWITKRKRWLVLSLVMFFLSFIFIAGDGTRGNFIKTIILYTILYSYIRKLNWRFMIWGFVGIVLLAILMSLYSPKMGYMIGQEKFLTSAITKIMNRIFIGNSMNDVYAIEYFRDKTIEYRFGALHMRDLEAAIPGTGGGEPFSYELYLLLNSKGNTTTYESGTYITTAFIDFGIIGVVFIYFFIGIMVGICQKVIFRFRKDPLSIVMVASLSFYFGDIVITGPISAMVSLGLILLLYVPIKWFLKMKWRLYSNVKPLAGKPDSQPKQSNA